MGNGRLVYWLLGLLATIALASGAQALKISERVVALEAQSVDLRRSLDRIESKLDRIIESQDGR